MPQRTSHQVRHSSPLPLEPVDSVASDCGSQCPIAPTLPDLLAERLHPAQQRRFPKCSGNKDSPWLIGRSHRHISAHIGSRVISGAKGTERIYDKHRYATSSLQALLNSCKFCLSTSAISLCTNSIMLYSHCLLQWRSGNDFPVLVLKHFTSIHDGQPCMP